jgi:adenylate cyclase
MSVSREQLVRRAGVDEDYIERLHELGVLRGPGDAYEERDVHVAALLHMWERAGLSAPAILAAVEAGTLSLDFLDSPAWELPEPFPITYLEFAEQHRVPLHLLQGIHEAMGFAAPQPEDRVPPDDAVLADLARIVLDLGVSDEGVRRLFGVYADNIRRLAMAESDFYLEQLEKPWAGSGADESELMLRGAEVGRRMAGAVERALQAIYERQRQHIWTGYGVQRAEMALERAGLLERAVSTPAICFVDMTGFTRLTEEQGDETAARLATLLGALVNEVSRAHRGRAIRWLGDGGLLYFEDTSDAFTAALEMSERASATGLPPTHIGVQAGPVVFRDGDVYGRTVNIASRIADHAEAGEVLTSQQTVDQMVGDVPASFEPARSVELKGVTDPVVLYRVFRRDRDSSADELTRPAPSP